MNKRKNKNSEETINRIKEAAHELFLMKGFASTTIRDVADRAGTNVALLSYHFGNKKNLFEVVMVEKIQELFASIAPIVNDPDTPLQFKIEQIAARYIDYLRSNPEIPTFVLNEIRKNNFDFIANTELAKHILESPFIQQLKEANPQIQPTQFLISLISMVVFPFVAKPAMLRIGLADSGSFEQMMEDRKQLIPLWIQSMINTEQP